MMSAARDYGLPNGSSLSRSLQAPFAGAHGNYDSYLRQQTRQTDETADAASQGGKLDTLDFAPPSNVEIKLRSIKALLDQGEFEQAAIRLNTLLESRSDLDFTYEQEQRLHSLMEQTHVMAAENASPAWLEMIANDLIRFFEEMRDSKPSGSARSPESDMEDLAKSLGMVEGGATIGGGIAQNMSLGLGLGLF